MPLNSWEFLGLAACAVVAVPMTRGWLRTAIFLALNLAFVWSYWGPAAMPVGLAFCLAGYAAARFVRGRGTGVLVASLVILTAAFAYLRGYTLGGPSAPAGSTSAGIIAIAGLSFLFFKMIHVIVDAASGSIEELPLGRYLNYCLNFTTVLMGPIQRYQDFSAQWNGETAETPRFETYVDAANRALRGFVKAFVLAPVLAPYVLRPGLPIERMGGLELLVAIYAFYVFLYLDFSGYCDIVIGVGGLMGIRPPENFRFPFLARDVSAYWLRVHRSLTTWLTDYIFTPFYRFALGAEGIGRYGFLVLSASLVLTMLVAGVWHGTTLNFVVFGLVHGVALVVVRAYEQVMVQRMGRAGFRKFAERPLVTAAAVFLTYNFTSLAYVFFVLDVPESVRVVERLAATVGLAP
ncbi:MAG TPA: MBOAT family O-acyltransferase [Vicinamibacterales bacterium]|nr:MBOAT family O-acyltransferase [Vicinamibacterales bacterium]